MKKVLTLVLTSVMMTGCATSSFVLNGQAGAVSKETTEHYFVSGLGQAKETDAAAICGGANRVAKVEVHTRPLDGVLGALTYGIYTPRGTRVYCSN